MEIIIPTHMNLENKDQKFIQLQQLIEHKRKMLLDKQNKYKKIKKQNHFLEEIKHDYSKYSNHIIEQKQQQIQALNMLKTYIDDLSTSGNINKHRIKEAKHEQNKIINEIKSIKQNLDEIIQSDNI